MKRMYKSTFGVSCRWHIAPPSRVRVFNRTIHRQVLSLPSETSDALGELSASYTVLVESVDGCDNSGTLSALLSSFDFDAFVSEVQSELQDLDQDSLSELASDVSICILWASFTFPAFHFHARFKEDRL